MMKTSRRFFLPLLLAAVGGCGFRPAAEPLPRPVGPWTVILYFGLDNYQFGTFPTDLGGLTDNLAGGASFMARPQTPIIFLYDGGGIGDTKILELAGRTLLDDQGAVIPLTGPNAHEVNYGDPEIMARFIIWAAKNFPARHYLLGLCHHYGWQGYNTDENSPGPLGMDIITLPEHARAMAEVKAAGVKIDLIWFEACSITMLETLYQYAADADFVIGNEDTIDFYAQLRRLSGMMAWLRENPAATPEELAKELVRQIPLITPSLLTNQFLPLQYVSMKKSPGGKAPLSRLGSSWSPTQFAFKGPEVQAAANALDHLARLLLSDLPRYRPALISARARAKEYSLCPWYVDLHDFVGLLAAHADDPQISTAVQTVQTAIDQSIFAKKILPRDRRHHGVLILFPLSREEWENEKINRFAPANRYSDLAFARDTAWDEFLENFFKIQE